MAASKSASVTGGGRSILFRPTSTNEPVRGMIQTQWTTSDGVGGVFPRRDQTETGSLFSGEVRPRAGGEGAYEADFVRFFYSTNGHGEWGTMVFNFPTNDSDGDGLPDFIQTDRAVAVGFSGWVTNETQQLGSGLTGSLQRDAGASVGRFWLQTTNPAYPLACANVLWRVGYGAGALLYSRGVTNLATLRFSMTDAEPADYEAKGTTTFSVPNRDTIVFEAFTLTNEFSDLNGDPTNFTVAVAATTFRRVGNRYLGDLELADGDTRTSWADYTHWALVISDANDLDANGIPDLSDDMVFAPVIVVPPGSTLAAIGQEVRLGVSALGTAPLSYRWFLNGAPLSQGGRFGGVLTSNLVITGVQAADAGNYTVVVSNLAGMVTSSPPAVLTLKAGPSILTAPQSVTGLHGQQVFFSVTAGGEAPLAYQWLRNGVPLAEGGRLSGTAKADLVLSGLQLGDVGSYSVWVTNTVGAVTSAPAFLSMDTTRLPPNDVLAFSESWLDRITNSGGFPDVIYTYQGVLTATVYWEGLGAMAFDSNTVLSVSMGQLDYRRQVGAAIQRTANTVVFLDSSFTNYTDPGEPLHFGATFTREGDTGLLTMTNTEYSVGGNYVYFAALNYLDQGYAGPVQGSLPVRIDFGPYSTVRTLHFSGTVSFSANTNSTGDPDADPFLYDIRVTGSNDLSAPRVQIVTPAAQSTWSNPLVVISGTASDPQGVGEVWVRVNQSAFALAFGTNTWSCPALLAPGTNVIQVQAYNGLGNLSTPTTLNCVFHPPAR